MDISYELDESFFEPMIFEIEMDKNQFDNWLQLLGPNPDKEIFMYRTVTKMEHDGSWTFIPFEELQNGDIYILFDEFPNKPVNDYDISVLLAISNPYKIGGPIPGNYAIEVLFYCNYIPTLPY